MTNLSTANDAITTELEKVRQGAAYYQARIAALEAVLAQLALAEGGVATAGGTGARRGRKPGKVVAVPPAKRRGRPPKAASESANVATKAKAPSKSKGGKKDLPSTGGDYWLNLVSDEPRSAVEILDAAVAGLGFSASPEQRKKLQQRMIGALNALAATGAIKDSGAGRARRYFK